MKSNKKSYMKKIAVPQLISKESLRKSWRGAFIRDQANQTTTGNKRPWIPGGETGKWTGSWGGTGKGSTNKPQRPLRKPPPNVVFTEVNDAVICLHVSARIPDSWETPFLTPRRPSANKYWGGHFFHIYWIQSLPCIPVAIFVTVTCPAPQKPFPVLPERLL